MRRVPFLYGVFLLLAGFLLARATAIPVPFVAAQDGFGAPEEVRNAPSNRARQAPIVESTVFASDDDAFESPPPPFARDVAQAAPRQASRSQPLTAADDPFGFARAKGEAAPRDKAAPAFIPTPLAASTEQEEKYLNAALKVFRGLGETERQAEFAQMIGRMEEQDAAAELLRLRTELQQLSQKYPKTGAAKQALEAIQTLPVVNPPEAQPGEKAEEAAAPAAPLPANPGFTQDLR